MSDQDDRPAAHHGPDYVGHSIEARDKLTELIRDSRICMLTTMTRDGRHVSRPMALQEVEFDGDLWFFADESSSKVADIVAHPQVNVSFNAGNSAWVSLSGTAETVQDRAKAEALWRPALRGWFPDGVETPGITLLRVHAESAEYWDSPHGRLITLIQYAASAALRKPPPEGDNKVLDLS